jgi:hypothetical protein
MDIGPLDPQSIEEAPGPLPVRPPADAVLTVAEVDTAGRAAVHCGLLAGRPGRPGESARRRPAHRESVPPTTTATGRTRCAYSPRTGRKCSARTPRSAKPSWPRRSASARGAPHRVARGATAPWRPTDRFRHAAPATLGPLTDDLSTPALNGYRLHHLLLRSLGRATGAGTYGAAEHLRRILARPGVIQVALKDSARHVLLSKGNPLGLSYIPFVLPSIRVSGPDRSTSRAQE